MLDLREHKHTAKRIAHQHTSYRGLWLVLAIAGVCLLFIRQSATAAEYVVSAQVMAPIPSIPASIDSPTDKSTVYSHNLIVSGVCPVINPPIIVGIYNNANELLASSGCSSIGQFFASVHLVDGENILIPKVHTITDEEGPSGPPITITLTTPSNNPEPDLLPINISYDGHFLTYKVNQVLSWQVDVQGGYPPYLMNIDWGDDVTEDLEKPSAGEETFEHTYRSNGTHLIHLTVTDSRNQTTTTSVAAITLAGGSGSVDEGDSSQSGAVEGVSALLTKSINKVVLVSYSGTLVLVSIFWFGAFKQKKNLLLLGKKWIKK
jgi:hypothetical protein